MIKLTSARKMYNRVLILSFCETFFLFAVNDVLKLINSCKLELKVFIEFENDN